MVLANRLATRDEMKVACELYEQPGQILIHPNAQAAYAAERNGTWIQAWVFIPKEPKQEEE